MSKRSNAAYCEIRGWKRDIVLAGESGRKRERGRERERRNIIHLYKIVSFMIKFFK